MTPTGGCESRGTGDTLVPVRPSIAFLVLAHRNGPQVARLVRRLRTDVPDSSVVVRQDHRTLDVSNLLPYDLGHVYLRDDGGPSEWGDWSLVETAMEALTWINTRLPYDWVVCLSGQDYPTQHLSQLQELLATTDADGFLDCQPLDRPLDIKWLRYHYRWCQLPHPGGRLSVRYWLDPKLWQLVTAANSLVGEPAPFALWGYPRGLPTRFGVRRRHTPFSVQYPCWTGSAWWTLRRSTAEYLVHEYRTNPFLTKYYRRCVLPEESYFHTVLRNRPGVRLGHDLHYVEWNREESQPYVFGSEDLDDIVRSGKPFVRKVDSSVDVDLLDLLDQRARRPDDGTQGVVADP